MALYCVLPIYTQILIAGYVKMFKNILMQVKLIIRQRRTQVVWLIFVLLSLPHFNPTYFDEQVPEAELLINIWRIISTMVFLVLILGIRKRVSLISILIGIQQGYVVINTVLQRGNIFGCAITAVSIVSVVLLYDMMQDEKAIFLSSQLFCFEILIYVNLLTVILFPKGMYTIDDVNISLAVTVKNYFLGYYNTHTKIFIPALMIAFLYKEVSHKKIRTWLLTAAIFTTAILVWSGGELVALFGMAIVYILFKNRTRLFNYYSYWSLHIWFFVLIICLKLQNLFRWLIDDILGKWNSLNGRMTLWDRTMDLILDSWVFGFGTKFALERELEGGFDWAGYAHNLLLELMYKGGIINIIFFLMIVIIAGLHIFRYKNSEESKIISIAFLGWCITDLVEAFFTPFLLAMFVVAYYSNYERNKVILKKILFIEIC